MPPPAGLKLPVTVSWKAGADRSGQQNALQWIWANETAQQLGDRGPEDVQAEWKLTIGIPILRADDPDFRDLYDQDVRPISYPRKIKLMKMGFPVTSIMKVRQMVRFLDEVERISAEMGVRLSQPDDDLAKYHNRYREKAA